MKLNDKKVQSLIKAGQPGRFTDGGGLVLTISKAGGAYWQLRTTGITGKETTVSYGTLGYGNEDHTPHGFRATARTLLAEVLNWRTEIIEAQLAHTVKDALGRAYNRTTWIDQRKKMMQAWADYLDGRAAAGVVPLRLAA